MHQDQPYYPDDPLLNVDQIIAYLNISRTQFWRLRGTGDFPQPLRISKGILRWKLSQLHDWLNRKMKP
jgi:predicted DNA-binding transcriptional regulator AlpA